MTPVESAYGALSVGDLIAYPRRGGQRLAIINEIRVSVRRHWNTRELIEETRIYVRPEGSPYSDAVLKNPKNVVKVAA